MTVLRPSTVADVMTRQVVTVFEEDSLDGLEEGMKWLRFRHLPVVDDGKLVGLLTERDLLRWAIRGPRAERTFVADVMNRHVTTVAPDTPVARAAELMLERKIDCLPVVEGDGKLVGIVTTADLLRLVTTLYEGG
ncbi:MAG: CBS domain-containing protein [Myxococcota bacterium]|nr:CBS domain-containing protein [Myxococcota bacterium]MDW8363431.1 CBS domain-containing protein [Myxococcales bacterium]